MGRNAEREGEGGGSVSRFEKVMELSLIVAAVGTIVIVFYMVVSHGF